MELRLPFINRRKVIAPCQPDGVVNSVWKPENSSIEEAMYAISDDESKGAECRCKLGRCCVDGKNHVIDGVALNLH